MSNENPGKRNDLRTVARALVVVLAATFLGAAAGASAQEIRTYPGSTCQATGSAQDLYYGGTGFVIANRGDSANSAVCPIVRVNGLKPWTTVAVIVRDRHSTDDVTCIARARDLTAVSRRGMVADEELRR